MKFYGYCNAAENKADCAKFDRAKAYLMEIPVRTNGAIMTGHHWDDRQLYKHCLVGIDFDGSLELNTLPIICQQTMIVQTGSGGYHLYFWVIDDIISNASYKNPKSPTLKGIDIRGQGGLLFAPGSKFDEHKFIYTIVNRTEPSQITKKQFNLILQDLLLEEKVGSVKRPLRKGFKQILDGDYIIEHGQNNGKEEMVYWKSLWRELFACGYTIEEVIPILYKSQPSFDEKETRTQLKYMDRDKIDWSKRPTTKLYNELFPHINKIPQSQPEIIEAIREKVLTKAGGVDFIEKKNLYDQLKQAEVLDNKGDFEEIVKLAQSQELYTDNIDELEEDNLLPTYRDTFYTLCIQKKQIFVEAMMRQGIGTQNKMINLSVANFVYEHFRFKVSLIEGKNNSEKLYFFNGSYYKYISDAEFCKGIKYLFSLITHWTYQNSNGSNIYKMVVAEASITKDDFFNANTGPYIPLENGYFNIKTMQLEDPDPDHLYLNTAAFSYDPEADCPEFKRNLERFIPVQEWRDKLLAHLAMCFSPNQGKRIHFVLVGDGDNFKSTLCQIAYFMFRPFCCQIPLKELGGDKADKFVKAMFQHKWINIGPELGKGALSPDNIDTVKEVLEEAVIKARGMHTQTQIEFRNLHLGLYPVNHTTRIKSHMDKAFFKRWIIIPFIEHIHSSEIITDYGEKLFKKEAPGIFNYIISFLPKYNTLIQRETRRSQELWSFYASSGDAFIDLYVREPAGMLEEPMETSEVYAKYIQWCVKYKRSNVPSSEFSKYLYERGASFYCEYNDDCDNDMKTATKLYGAEVADRIFREREQIQKEKERADLSEDDVLIDDVLGGEPLILETEVIDFDEEELLTDTTDDMSELEKLEYDFFGSENVFNGGNKK